MAEIPDTSGPKTRRGGKRPGAGRKPKGFVKPSALSELNKISALATEPPAEIDGIAQQSARDAIENLVKLLFYAGSESAKITAAKEILDRGYGKPAVEIGGDAAMLPFMMAPVGPAGLALGGYPRRSPQVRQPGHTGPQEDRHRRFLRNRHRLGMQGAARSGIGDGRKGPHAGRAARTSAGQEGRGFAGCGSCCHGALRHAGAAAAD